MKKIAGFLFGSVIGIIAGMVMGVALIFRKFDRQVKVLRKNADKFQRSMLMMNKWLEVKQEGKDIAGYCLKKNYKKIAIYGMNYVGVRLYDEFAGSDVDVAYGIDKAAPSVAADFEVLSYSDEFPNVDAVIVTPVYYFFEIKEELGRRMACPIVSLEDVLYEL